jgi:hypothetical protein
MSRDLPSTFRYVRLENPATIDYNRKRPIVAMAFPVNEGDGINLQTGPVKLSGSGRA